MLLFVMTLLCTLSLIDCCCIDFQIYSQISVDLSILAVVISSRNAPTTRESKSKPLRRTSKMSFFRLPLWPRCKMALNAGESGPVDPGPYPPFNHGRRPLIEVTDRMIIIKRTPACNTSYSLHDTSAAKPTHGTVGRRGPDRPGGNTPHHARGYHQRVSGSPWSSPI